jgi:MscS family membrane protein
MPGLPLLAQPQAVPIAPAVVEFTTDQFQVRNLGAPAAITLRRAGNTNTVASVSFVTSGGTAIEGRHYRRAEAVLRFGVGQLEATIQVPLLTEAGMTGDTTVGLELRSPAEGTVLGRYPNATLTIIDVNQVRSSWASFGLDRIPFFHRLLAGIPLWQYVGSILYIVLAFLVSRMVDYVVRVKLRSLARRTATQWDDLLLEILHGPVRVIAFVVFLHVGLRIYIWPDWMTHLLRVGLHIVVAVSLTYLLLKAVDIILGQWRRRAGAAEQGFDQQLFPVIRISVRVFIIVVALLMTSQNLGLDITGALASLSIGGLALGLAAQDTIANIFGAVSVFVDKPFRIGDRIRIDATEGVVEGIGLRSTRVRNNDGHLVTIPNKTMGNATIINISRRPTIRTELNLGLTYNTPQPKLQQALGILQEVLGKHPRTADLVISFNRFAESSLNILVVHQWNGSDQKEYLAGMQAFNLEIKERFEREGIQIAFPSQTVYLRSDSPVA